LAGGGVRGGQVYGSSDRTAAYPSTNPVSPADVAATIYHCLGIDPLAPVTDQQGRPLVLATGKPIHAVLGQGGRPCPGARSPRQRRGQSTPSSYFSSTTSAPHSRPGFSSTFRTPADRYRCPAAVNARSVHRMTDV